MSGRRRTHCARARCPRSRPRRRAHPATTAGCAPRVRSRQRRQTRRARSRSQRSIQMAKGRTKNSGAGGKKDKQVTRYTYEDVKEPRTPETGHTALLPADEQVVTLPMDNGWSKGLQIGKLPEGDARPVVVDMDP